MSDTTSNDEPTEPTSDMSRDAGSNASGNQSGDSAETYDIVDSGQSEEDIENSLTGQGTSDRTTLMDIAQEEGDAISSEND